MIIDGQNNNLACYIGNLSGTPVTKYINFEGISCRNGGNGPFTSIATVTVRATNYANLKHITAYDAKTANIIAISDSSNYILLEDCAAMELDATYRPEVTPAIIALYSNDVTIRRCYVRGGDYTWTSGSGSGIRSYEAPRLLLENNVVINDEHDAKPKWGFDAWGHSTGNGDDNKWYGNIAVLNGGNGIKTNSNAPLSGHDYRDNVIIDAAYGMSQVAVSDLILQNNTFVLDATLGVRGYEMTSGSPTPLGSTLKNNSFISKKAVTTGLYNYSGYAIANTYNNIYGFNTPYTGETKGTGERFINPGYDTPKYGNGAYLMVPLALQGQGEGGADIGAEVLYRYINGVKTSTPLWPWPMEERICKETGYSVTYENGYSGCAKGGGLWKTLDGVYSATDTTPPAAPQGVTVQ